MSALNLLVFREDRRTSSGRDVQSTLLSQLRRLQLPCSQEERVRAMLLAGEQESAAADADFSRAGASELISDCIADALIQGKPDREKISFAYSLLTNAELPDKLNISTPEGFAYYALHPLAYADVLDHLGTMPSRLLVVGIRSIGATLSAVTAAAARARGIDTRRITVRPQGHPYHRRTGFLPHHLALIRRAAERGATFMVVDEGPGLSGSSFLSVAEALEATGVARERITLVPSHLPDADALCANDASARWRRFHSQPVNAAPLRPQDAGAFIGGGEWRHGTYLHDAEWPPVWTSFERIKYRSRPEAPEPRFFKFVGLGHYGDAVLEREAKVAAAGFGVMPRAESYGFASYPWIHGRAMTAKDLSAGVVTRLAAYCAFRAAEIRTERGDLSALQRMAEHNLQELRFNLPVEPKLHRPVIADGKMQPHEWVITENGAMVKADSGSHGDDHFFPGPTDIAWDLAGAIVEWRMNAAQTQAFVEAYRRASGDDAGNRIDEFIKAYTVFRCAYCLMAANALHGSQEQARLEQAASLYRARILSHAIEPVHH